MNELKPFIKWAGGKRGIIEELLKRLPSSIKNYHEPFVGGGALLFELKNQNSFICDTNSELIYTYKVIKNNPTKLMSLLDQHQLNHSETYFYSIRNNFISNTMEEEAARFIYLNKSCFNGLYRVNKNGVFNTPSGKVSQAKLKLYDKDNILNIHSFLQNVTINESEYNSITPAPGDFVYLDPPYYGTYNQYNKNKFEKQQHEDLFKFFESLTNNGINVMMSNSNCDFIKNLYSKYRMETIIAPRSINRNVNGRMGDELIIRNY